MKVSGKQSVKATSSHPRKAVKNAVNEAIISPTDKRVFALVEVLKTIGKIVYDYDFAEAIDIPKQYLTNIRAGKHRFTLENIEKICEVYKVNPSWLFGYDNEMFRNFPL